MDRKIVSNKSLIIGNFEVIHKGHLKLFNSSKNFSIYTFKNLPNKTQKPLYSFEEKINNLKLLNPQDIYVLDLKKDNQASLKFVNKLLKEVKPKEIIVGSDFKFGSDNKTINYLKKFFKVIVINRNKKYSTTKIRQLISLGDLTSANKMLFKPFYVSGIVIKGKQLGRKLGYKTANIIRTSDLQQLKTGVYAGTTIIGNSKKEHLSAISVRMLDNTKQIIESHIINKNLKEFYGKKIKINLFKHIQETKKPKTIEDLKLIVKQNVKKASRYFDSTL